MKNDEEPMEIEEQNPKRNHNKMQIESEDEEDNKLLEIMKANKQKFNRKKADEDLNYQTTPEKEIEVEIKNPKALSFSQLPENIEFYLTQIYYFANNKLFITGLMENKQTFSIVATNPMKEIYFCLKREFSDVTDLTQEFLEKAKREIHSKLHSAGITNFTGDFEEKKYVFEIDGVPRQNRPYYKVRYLFNTQVKEDIRPDDEGETYKFVFGTSYTPLELFIINAQIKGPSWVQIEKQYLIENTKNAEVGLCADLLDPEMIESLGEGKRPPNIRVMSISVKALIPLQIKSKKLFPNNGIQDLTIYSIGLSYCDNYMIEMKPAQYKLTHRVFHLKEFAKINDKTFVQCQSEKEMLALFQSELRQLDPDVIVCHDSSKVIDTLIMRMMKINHKNEKPKLGRLQFMHEVSKFNQVQRINSSVAGRLIADTYIHSKDMIRSVDYELEAMAAHIKSDKIFKGFNDQEIKSKLDQGKSEEVIRKVREETEVTFALMNHLEILQITRQLSNICGIIWKRSLQNQRAERNQFLIMHECSKKGLIIPDKFKKERNSSEEGEEKDKKYQGGYVLDPKKGIYSDFILLLDFNSLYPSIIRQYNVCFSVIKRPMLPMSHYYKSQKEKKKNQNSMEEEEFSVAPPPKEECSKDKWGFLPQLIDKIVDRRNKCKKSMKNAPPEKVIILDIQQKCYKLVANSIYGCLGFSISRFYSKHLAALITRMGREALIRAKDIVGNMGGVDVIYGDTDSLMIQPTALSKETDRQKLFEIKQIADNLKKNINKEYTNLEIDIDGIFKPLILLMKKKYVARKLKNFDNILAHKDMEPVYNIEYKGIEVVRRDGFQLSRDFLKKILEIFMESKKTQSQEIYQEIYEYARQIRKQFSTLNFRKFLFSKQLNKSPKEYNRGETMPHVKVAMDRMKGGETEQMLVNHTIFYIVCKAKDSSDDMLAKNCYDDRTFERSQKFPGEKGALQFDEDYYKREMLQPVARITLHLEGFDNDRLCEELGVSDDARKKFKKQLDTEREDGEITFEGFLTHNRQDKSKKISEEFEDLSCGKCGEKSKIAENGILKLYCSKEGCKRNLLPMIQNKISFLLKQKTSEYYVNKYRCKCQKQYQVTPICQCCKINSKPRSNTPFQLHELIYLMKDLCNLTLKVASAEDKIKLEKVEDMLDKFLADSKFEEISGLMSILNL